MRLNKEAIEEFKEIYYCEFGQRISDEQAQEMGTNLLLLFKIIYRPLPRTSGQDEANKTSNDPE